MFILSGLLAKFSAPTWAEWSILILVFAVPAIFLIVMAIFMTRRIQQSQAAANQPGLYSVLGVDRTTRQDRQLLIDAASLENARIKAELDGIIVTHISRQNSGH